MGMEGGGTQDFVELILVGVVKRILKCSLIRTLTKNFLRNLARSCGELRAGGRRERWCENGRDGVGIRHNFSFCWEGGIKEPSSIYDLHSKNAQLLTTYLFNIAVNKWLSSLSCSHGWGPGPHLPILAPSGRPQGALRAPQCVIRTVNSSELRSPSAARAARSAGAKIQILNHNIKSILKLLSHTGQTYRQTDRQRFNDSQSSGYLFLEF